MNKTTLCTTDIPTAAGPGPGLTFDAVYQRYHRPVYLQLRRLTRNEVLARELSQEVFVRLWLKRDSLKQDKSIGAYLYRISHNLLMDKYRQLKRQRELLAKVPAGQEACENHQLQRMIAKEDAQRWEQAVQLLPARRRKIFMLCKMDGKSYQEVGRLLGISSSTISDHIVKATKMLRRQLGSAGTPSCIVCVFSLLGLAG